MSAIVPPESSRRQLEESLVAPPVGVAVVGLGRAGTFHLERLGLREDCRVIAAFDECPAARRAAEGLAPALADDWRGLLRDDSVDLLVLATPPATHAPLALAALAAGKHVLVETPLGLSVTEADAILAAASRAARSVIVAQTRRHDADFLAARACVASGTLGHLRMIRHINWHCPVLDDSERPLLHGAATPPPSVGGPSSWRDLAATGGGALWELGLHDFDQLLLLAGELPQWVFAQWTGGAPAAQADDGFLALVRFPSGLAAHIEVSRAWPLFWQTGWILAGDRGGCRDGTQFLLQPDGELADEPLPPVAEAPDAFYAAAFEHLRGRGPNPAPPEEARSVAALLDATRLSARQGRPVAVDVAD